MLLTGLTLTSCDKTYKTPSLIKEKKPKDFLGFDAPDSEALKTLQTAEQDSSLITTLNHFYQYFWEGNDLWGDFLVAQGNTILIEKYRGFSNLEDSIPINSHTPIHLASISKNITAMLILKLIEKNKIKLHQKVKEILPHFPYPEITIFDLLTHRSGLGGYDYYAEDYHWISEDSTAFTNQRMYKMFVECEPALLFKPNTYHSYSNTNYAFLALIIEQITQMSFPEAMRKLVFEPLEMKDSYVFTQAQKDTATLSYYYRKKPWKWDHYDYIYGDKNIYSTARDLLKYSQAMFTPNFLRKSLLDSAMRGYSYEKAGIKNYGLGFRLREFDNQKKIVFHTGRWHGNNTLFMHLPDEQLTVIALGNRLSRANYSAFTLVSLFGDYPLDLEGEDELLKVSDEEAQRKIDSIKALTEPNWKKNNNPPIDMKKKKKDSLPTVKLNTKTPNKNDTIMVRKDTLHLQN